MLSKENNSKKIIYKKSSKNIINNKKNNNSHTRNTNNSTFNGLKKLKSDILYNTINYEKNDFKKIPKFSHIQLKPKIQTKNSILPVNKISNRKKKFINNQFNKEKNQFCLKKTNHNNNNQEYNKVYNSKNNTKFISNNKKDKNKNKYQYKSNKISARNSTYNKPYNLVINNQNNKNIIKTEMINEFENDNDNNHCNTDRKINPNYLLKNKSSNKALINFMNINNSSNSLLHVKRNLKLNKAKIKANILNKNHKLIISPHLSNNFIQNNNYWKIYKKPKNCCLLNKFNNDNNKYNSNNIENYKGNSQFIKVKENKPQINYNNFSEENNSVIINEYFNSHNKKKNINNNNNCNMTETKNKEKEKQGLNNKQQLNIKQIYQNFNKINRRKDSFRNKSNENRQLIDEEDNINIQNEALIRLSILRNNTNNQIIKEFSVVVGEEKNKKEKNKSEQIIIIDNKNIKNNEKLNDNKKTIINFNQYYPSYFINANDILKSENNNIESNNLI
jgi:hypothetical protein